MILALYAVFGVSVSAYAKYGLGATYGSKEFVNGIFVPYVILAISLVVYCYYRRSTYELPNPTQRIGWKLVLLAIIPTLVLSGYVISTHASLTKAFLVPFVMMLAVGISEELVFRKIVITSLLKEVTSAKTILFSAVIFSALHVFNIIAGQTLGNALIQLVMTLLAGLTYGVFYMYTKNIGVMILLHWLWDYVLISGVITPRSPWSMLVSAVPLLELIAMFIILFKYQEIRTKEYLTQ